MPDPVTVSNSSCLIGLELIGRIELLHGLYGTVVVPTAVAEECGFQLPEWFEVRTVQNNGMVRSLRLERRPHRDRGSSKLVNVEGEESHGHQDHSPEPPGDGSGEDAQ
jgi:predicted nucleic acid-binding protein